MPWQLLSTSRQAGLTLHEAHACGATGEESPVSMNIILYAPLDDTRAEERCKRFALQQAYSRLDLFYLVPVPLRARGAIHRLHGLPEPRYLATALCRLLCLTLGPVVAAWGDIPARPPELRACARALRLQLLDTPLLRQRLNYLDVTAAGSPRLPLMTSRPERWKMIPVDRHEA